MDHEQEYLQFARADGHGDFFLYEWTSGLAATDREFGRRLRSGARLLGRIVPGRNGDPVTVSLLPEAIRHLEGAVCEQQMLRREPTNFYKATVVEGPNEWGAFVVELDHHDELLGLSHRFEFKKKKLEWCEGTIPTIGQRVLVALAMDRSKYRRCLPADSASLIALAKKHSSSLRVVGGEIRATDSELTLKVLDDLLAEKSYRILASGPCGYFLSTICI